MSESDTCSEQDFSEDDLKLTWAKVRRYKMKFGKYKGKSLEDMIKTHKRRSILSYYLGWTELRNETRQYINYALNHYRNMKPIFTIKNISKDKTYLR